MRAAKPCMALQRRNEEKMSIFKCKMCGGTLEFAAGDTVAVCDSCGSRQTLPRLDDERRANLYDRANHFRRNDEFDRAMGIYEQILNEDSTDAEAYWSIVLCRYGIEYVEDPATRRRVPTVNRTQFTSIFDDDNYQSAIRYADGAQREVYKEEAQAINEIQKGILAISEQEEPFDVFICYKETDNGGRRTQDSVLANDLYHELTEEGFKVFFSRITLEDKLGTAYEPYIFAALNSARVMVVIGTRPEYYNAVWVKNEWSRYLALIKGGAKKVLIPAYRDMNPYDLPEEFSHLQAQDMAKLGFMQDLIRGIKKIAAETTGAQTVATGAVSAPTAPLLKRAFLFLEDGRWEEADEYCEKVLDQDPECAGAYIGKLMAELHITKQEALAEAEESYSQLDNYRKAYRFADEALKAVLNDYIGTVNTRIENNRMEAIYVDAVRKMGNAKNEQSCEEAAHLFEKIVGYKDAAELREHCLERAENCRKDRIYGDAQNEMNGGRARNYETAIKHLQMIAGWKDADELLRLCQIKLEEAKIREETERIAAIKRAKRKKGIFIAVILFAVAGIALMLTYKYYLIPEKNYQSALALMEAGNYTEAYNMFDGLGEYKDSVMMLDESMYRLASREMEAGNYTEAYNVFAKLGEYKDSVMMLDESMYRLALRNIEEQNYLNAYKCLRELGDYKDGSAKCDEIKTVFYQEMLETVKVGEEIYYGAYEQDGYRPNGKEIIKWLVLAREENRFLVISKDCLDTQPYHNTYCDEITWETCSLRGWLNETFLEGAFDDDERARIVPTIVSNPNNLEYATSGGNDTLDSVFLLSWNEVDEYLAFDVDRQATPTAYAKGRGAFIDEKGRCAWWLRSPGRYKDQAISIMQDGYMPAYGKDVNDESIAVRPAMWIDLGE